jgi:hypothetical protein
MIFVYFYSKGYEFYHNHIQKNLSNVFQLHPIFVEEFPERKKDSDHFHHFAGITLKVELVIDCIKKFKGFIVNTYQYLELL